MRVEGVILAVLCFGATCCEEATPDADCMPPARSGWRLEHEFAYIGAGTYRVTGGQAAGVDAQLLDVELDRAFVIQTTEVTVGEVAWVAQRYFDMFDPGREAIRPGEAASWPIEWPLDGVLRHADSRSLIEGREPCYGVLDCGDLGGNLRRESACAEVLLQKDTSQCNGYRLPSGVEWEIAARMGWRASCERDEDCMQRYAWFYPNRPHIEFREGLPFSETAQLCPNGAGIYDMFGNLPEWTIDTSLPTEELRTFDPDNPVRMMPRVEVEDNERGEYLCLADEPQCASPGLRYREVRGGWYRSQLEEVGPTPVIWAWSRYDWAGFRLVRYADDDEIAAAE